MFETVPDLGKGGETVARDLGGSDSQLFNLKAASMGYIAAFCELIDGVIENHAKAKDSDKITTLDFRLYQGGSVL